MPPKTQPPPRKGPATDRGPSELSTHSNITVKNTHKPSDMPPQEQDPSESSGGSEEDREQEMLAIPGGIPATPDGPPAPAGEKTTYSVNELIDLVNRLTAKLEKYEKTETLEESSVKPFPVGQSKLTPEHSPLAHPIYYPTVPLRYPHLPPYGDTSSHHSAPTTQPRPTPVVPEARERTGKLAMFNGKSSDWESWLYRARLKVETDGVAMGPPNVQVAYLTQRLDEKSIKALVTHQHIHGRFDTPEELLTFLDSRYGDPNKRASALTNLSALKMETGPKMHVKFRAYQDDFLSLLAAAGLDATNSREVFGYRQRFVDGLVPAARKGCVKYLQKTEDFQDFLVKIDSKIRTLEAEQAIDATTNQSASKTKSTSNSNGNSSAGDAKGKPYPKDVPDAILEARRQRRACLNCGRTGHGYTVCRSRTERVDSKRDDSKHNDGKRVTAAMAGALSAEPAADEVSLSEN